MTTTHDNSPNLIRASGAAAILGGLLVGLFPIVHPDHTPGVYSQPILVGGEGHAAYGLWSRALTRTSGRELAAAVAAVGGVRTRRTRRAICTSSGRRGWRCRTARLPADVEAR